MARHGKLGTKPKCASVRWQDHQFCPRHVYYGGNRAQGIYDSYNFGQNLLQIIKCTSPLADQDHGKQ